MAKKFFFYIDDNIFAFQQLAEIKPKSLFDIPFFGMLKDIHDKYGLKLQLNLFYELSKEHNRGTFTLAEVPDTYKSEWEANADWFRLAYHAKKEFPHVPHVNIDYDEMYETFKNIEREVFRFAGEKTFTYATCAHWLPVSKEGVQALYDCGVRVLDSTHGNACDYEDFTGELHDIYKEALMSNRKPEAKVDTNEITFESEGYNLSSWNHIPADIYDSKIRGTFNYVEDEDTGMKFKTFCSGIILNCFELDHLESLFDRIKDDELVGMITHEQYFHDFYDYYQPDTKEKIELMAKYFTEHGFEFIFAEDII